MFDLFKGEKEKDKKNLLFEKKSRPVGKKKHRHKHSSKTKKRHSSKKDRKKDRDRRKKKDKQKKKKKNRDREREKEEERESGETTDEEKTAKAYDEDVKPERADMAKSFTSDTTIGSTTGQLDVLREIDMKRLKGFLFDLKGALGDDPNCDARRGHIDWLLQQNQLDTERDRFRVARHTRGALAGTDVSRELVISSLQKQLEWHTITRNEYDKLMRSLKCDNHEIQYIPFDQVAIELQRYTRLTERGMVVTKLDA